MRAFAAAAMLLGGVAAAPLAAQQVPPPVRIASFEETLNGAMRDLAAGRFGPALTSLDALLKQPIRGERRAIVLASRAAVLAGQGDIDAAAAGFREANATAPDNRDVHLMQVRAGIAFGRPDLVMRPLTIIVGQHGDWLTLDDRELVTMALSMGVQSKRTREYEDLLLALADADYGSRDLVVRWDLAKEAATIAIRRGEPKRAAFFIGRIQNRDQIEGILTDRAFAASWPEIESAVGPHMAKLQDAAVQSAREAAAANGNDSVSLQALMQAYRMAGRLAEADAVGALIAASPADIPKLTERDAWALDEHANVLVAMGRYDEADRRWASLMALDVESHQWLIGMILNRAAARVAQRNWQAAAPLVAAVESQYAKYASPYAQQMIRWMQICLAKGRAQSGARDDQIGELMAHMADSRAFTIDALLCAGRDQQAATTLIAWLESGEKVGEAIGRLQPLGTLRDPKVGAADNAAWRGLLTRPGVRAAFDQVGRELPEAFWPVPISVTPQ